MQTSLFIVCCRYNQTVGGRPVASVRPMMSNPLNSRTSQSAGGNQARLLIPAGRGVAGLKPGVSLQQIQTTTGYTPTTFGVWSLKITCAYFFMDQKAWGSVMFWSARRSAGECHLWKFLFLITIIIRPPESESCKHDTEALKYLINKPATSNWGDMNRT